jgi:hypothetical protein
MRPAQTLGGKTRDKIETMSYLAESYERFMEPMTLTALFPNPEEFLAWEIDVDPAETPALQNLDAGAQRVILAAVRQDMQGPLERAMQDEKVVLPFLAHIVEARR